MSLWLMIASDPREFSGILPHASLLKPALWPTAAYAQHATLPKTQALLIANGPGFAAVDRALAVPPPPHLAGLLSLGFAGALDPSLNIGDIVLTGDCSPTGDCFSQSVPRHVVRGEMLSMDRVAVTAEEKRKLFAQSGAKIVEMESASVRRKAQEWGVPFLSVRAISDTAQDDMPLDFNRYRRPDGDFSRPRIALAALARPLTALPALLRLNDNCRIAAKSLGDFLVSCEL